MRKLDLRLLVPLSTLEEGSVVTKKNGTYEYELWMLLRFLETTEPVVVRSPPKKAFGF